VLGPEVGGVFEAIHRDQGVRFHFGQSVERFEGTARVEAVVTTTGSRIECDFTVVGVGIEPAVEVVAGSGVAVDNGILVDELCRTNVEGVYGAGDVANHLHPVFGIRMRVEHWDNALKQGAAAARAMMRWEVPFDDPHWFWSDQYDCNLQSMGFLADRDELVVRGSLEDRRFLAFYMKEGTVRGVVGLNTGKDVRRSARLIRSKARVDPGTLRNEEVDLRALAPVRKGGG
jgi:3-phenylpropionate/trans-cinnamate dioxygenase ferredoxin reductase subunit